MSSTDTTPDPLDAWRAAFEAIPDTNGQMTIWLGPNELEQVATLDEIQKQAASLADERQGRLV